MAPRSETSRTRRATWQTRARWSGIAIASLALLPVSPMGCGKRSSDGKTGSAKRPTGGSVPGALVAAWPAAAKGWVPDRRAGVAYRLDGTPQRYDRKTIFRLLDGGADAYLEAGLQSLLHARFRDLGGGHEDYEVLVFDLGSPSRARGLLAKEKGGTARRVKLGAAGWAERGAVLFVQGRYMVKVSALPVGRKKPAPVEAVARRVLATPGARW